MLVSPGRCRARPETRRCAEWFRKQGFPHPEVTANNARPDARMVQNKITREEQRRESHRSLRVSTESICKPKVDLGFVRMREIIEIEANHVNLNFPFVALEKAPRCGLPKGIRNPLNL